MMTEYLHENDYMPDRFYFQLNGKTAEDNYISQKRGFIDRLTADNNEMSNDEEQFYKYLLTELMK